MKNLTFEQRLAWLEWAQNQVATKYGCEIAWQSDTSVIDPPRFEAEHLLLIQHTTDC